MLDRGSAPQWPQAALPHLARLTTLGELTVLIAHELSQPLAAIAANGRASLQWLNEPTLGVDKARTSVQAMVNSAHRAGQIVQRLRALSRRAEMGKSLLLVNDVIDDVVPLVAAEMQSNGVTLQMDLARDLPLVLGDRVQLQQVLLNLLLNGMHAVASVPVRRRKLMIESRHVRGQLVVAVKDSGTGLDPDCLGRLFEPFFTTRPDGIGIGLTVCQSIIEAHRGRIWAARNRGPGATFKFTLPIAQLGQAGAG
jgi:C4-dicarboxylate-specific signal transduction histidine kinase